MTTAAATSPLLDNLDWQGKIYSDGWRAGGAGVIPIVNASTGESLGTLGVASAADVAAAAKSAAAAQTKWVATPRGERAAILEKAKRLLESHREEFAWWLVRESGSTQPKASFEIDITLGKFDKIVDELRTGVFEDVIAAEDGYRSVAERVPLGVVGVIGPFNFPLYLGLRAVIPALAFGNAVVLKPDQQTAVAAGILTARIFAEAGLPDGVLHVLPGDAEPGRALTVDPNIAMIAFTGSSAVGKAIGSAAGGNLKRVSLELGGNSPFIVLEDADVEAAARCGAWGSFLHQGQICMASSRHLVHESIAEEYAVALAAHAEKLVVGDPALENVHLGPIVNDRQVARVDRIVKESIGSGATLASGGTHEGRFYRPTVLTDVKPGMAAFDEEIFGPVAPIATFANDDEAVALANATDYGLSSSVHSKNLDRARAVARRLRTGMVHISDQTVNDDPRAPFGGVGASGNGSRQGGHASLDEYTTWRWSTERAEPPTYPF
ncbi:MAG: aldehyde dehydrogenase family protein [Candidatus Eremiobacteraeota bacterium]|nr:aldehyde dehydrogenase family protein [Candidatus Eremiobacteraeota bacterium]